MTDEEKALEAIDRIVGDDFCEELELDEVFDRFTDPRLKQAAEKILMVYKIAHAEMKSNICYRVHGEWRKLKDSILAEKAKEMQYHES